MRLRRLLPLVLLALMARPAAAATDPLRDKQWALDVVRGPVATGSAVVVAIVDTGIDLEHEDLASSIVQGTNFVEDGADPRDDHGHGTHVSGIAAALAGNGRGVAGVAPGARIMPVRALSNRCDGDQCQAAGSSEDVVAGIRWAADHGAHVVNLSIGGGVLLRNLLGSELESAIEYAWNKGTIPVVAAGNESFSSGYGDVPAIIVVATDRYDRIASYSNSSGGFLRGARWGLAAPGGSGTGGENDILSTFWRAGKRDQYAYMAGTSMATPYVAGAAALLRSYGLTPQQTVDRLLQTAKDLGPPGPDDTYGHGRIDVATAVAPFAAQLPREEPPPPRLTRRPSAPVRAAPPLKATPAPVPATPVPATPSPAPAPTDAPQSPPPPVVAAPARDDPAPRSGRLLAGLGALGVLAAAGIALRRLQVR